MLHIHGFMSCDRPEALTSTAIFTKCGVDICWGGLELCILSFFFTEILTFLSH